MGSLGNGICRRRRRCAREHRGVGLAGDRRRSVCCRLCWIRLGDQRSGVTSLDGLIGRVSVGEVSEARGDLRHVPKTRRPLALGTERATSSPPAPPSANLARSRDARAVEHPRARGSGAREQRLRPARGLGARLLGGSGRVHGAGRSRTYVLIAVQELVAIATRCDTRISSR